MQAEVRSRNTEDSFLMLSPGPCVVGVVIELGEGS